MQSFPFQMNHEAKSLLQLQIIWARSAYLSTKWANLTETPLHWQQILPVASRKGKAWEWYMIDFTA